ncbi:MAG: GTPase Era, partial [Clostridiales bacterium]
MSNFKSGFIALVGRPNAGKSTLINHLTGHKIAIVSDKPQTTRNSIRGVYTDEEMQAIFIDTPGVHKPKYQLGQRMMSEVGTALSGCDVIFYLVDATERFGAGEQYILQMIKYASQPVFLILNKIDLLTREQLLPLIAFYAAKFPFAEVAPISALKGDNSDVLKPLLRKYLPEGPHYYPDDTIS